MEAKEILRKRLFAILRAAIYGAALFDGMIVLTNFAYLHWGRGHGGFADFIGGLSWLIAISGGLVQGPEFPNIYIVDGLLGACAFSVIAAFWQFAFKTYEK
jgi:hypothetical protein